MFFMYILYDDGVLCVFVVLLVWGELVVARARTLSRGNKGIKIRPEKVWWEAQRQLKSDYLC